MVITPQRLNNAGPLCCQACKACPQKQACFLPAADIGASLIHEELLARNAPLKLRFPFSLH